MKIGYIHSRFQPFHKGHLAILLYILENYDELWIGIANPLRKFPEYFEFFDENLRESLLKSRNPEQNIFSFMDRRNMILNSLKHYNIDLNRIKILPHFAFYEETNWEDFMPPKKDTTILIYVKDVYSEAKIQEYEGIGWKVEKIPLFTLGFSSEIFFKEYPHANWRELVPRGTIEVIDNKGF